MMGSEGCMYKAGIEEEQTADKPNAEEELISGLLKNRLEHIFDELLGISVGHICSSSANEGNVER